MGKEYYVADKTFNRGSANELTLKDLEFFTWEKLDRVDDIKKEFDYNYIEAVSSKRLFLC